MNSIHQPRSSLLRYQAIPDFQFVEYSRGLYVTKRLLNNERKGDMQAEAVESFFLTSVGSFFGGDSSSSERTPRL